MTQAYDGFGSSYQTENGLHNFLQEIPQGNSRVS